MQKVALFGGAFDPMHEGHLHIAKLAQKKFNLDKVYFIPLKQAVHKAQPQLTPEARLAKIKEFIAGESTFFISTIELERQGASYAIDTVKAFLGVSSNKTDLDLYYIIGSDAFEAFFSWKEPYQLLALVKFIVVERPGYPFSKIEKIFNKEHNQDYLNHVFFIEDRGIDISSRQIREAVNDRDIN